MYALCLEFKYLRVFNIHFNYPRSRTFVTKSVQNWLLYWFSPMFLLIRFLRPLEACYSHVYQMYETIYSCGGICKGRYPNLCMNPSPEKYMLLRHSEVDSGVRFFPH
jgi:hypothetical protein